MAFLRVVSRPPFTHDLKEVMSVPELGPFSYGEDPARLTHRPQDAESRPHRPVEPRFQETPGHKTGWFRE